MRSRTKRATAVVLAGLLVVGVAGVTGAAAAAELPPTAQAAEPVPLPPRVLPKAPSGDEPVELIVGLRKGSDEAVSASRFERKAPVDVTARAALPDVMTVEVAADSAAEALATLRKDPAVAYAEVSGVFSASAVTPNDPMFSVQWNLDKTGVPTAWETTTGSSDVVVAVLDSGVTAVPDLASALLPGKDFVDGDSNAADAYGHGTMVASLLAANTNNGLGIAGACWSCRILPVRVLDENGGGTVTEIVKGIDFAVRAKVDIINMSFGGLGDNTPIRQAVKRATDAGIVVVAAAGNEGGTVNQRAKMYPAAYPTVISVGATDEDDDPFYFSNTGSWISIAAPGEAWMTAMDGDPELALGTSFSSPLVAGTAALFKAHRPTASAAEIRAALIGTAAPIGSTFGGGRLNAAKAVTDVADRVPPVVGGVTPASLAKVKGVVTVGATGVTDNVGVAYAALHADGKLVGRDTAAPYSVKYDSTKRNGTVKLEWRVFDAAGNSTVYKRSIIADNTAPKVSITSGPKNKAKVKGTVTLKVSATDKYGINRVELLINGERVATDKKSPYSFSIKVAKYSKKMKVQVRAYDAAGNVKYAPTRNWTR